MAQTYLNDQAPMGAAVIHMTYQLIDLKATTLIRVLDQDLTPGIAALRRFDLQISEMGRAAAPPAGATLRAAGRALASYVAALKTLRSAQTSREIMAALPDVKTTSAGWESPTSAVAVALGVPKLQELGSSLIPSTSALPSIPGIAPSTAYPGTAPNGWMEPAAYSQGLTIPAKGCQAETTYELFWVERDYYYDNSEVQDGDYGNASIGAFVAGSMAEADTAQRATLTTQYQTCFAQQEVAVLENTGTAVTGSPTITPVQSSVGGSAAIFNYAILYLANGVEQTYFMTAAFFQVGQYRAIVEEDGCCTAQPLSFMQQMVVPVEASMSAASPGARAIW